MNSQRIDTKKINPIEEGNKRESMKLLNTIKLSLPL